MENGNEGGGGGRLGAPTSPSNFFQVTLGLLAPCQPIMADYGVHSDSRCTESDSDSDHEKYEKDCLPNIVQRNRRLVKLESLLKTLKHASDYYSTGTRHLIMPQISVLNVGRLSFPILETQTQKMIAEAERAPFGLGDKTVVDLAVRKVWQLSAGAVSITGEHWKVAMSEILAKVSSFPA